MEEEKGEERESCEPDERRDTEHHAAGLDSVNRVGV